MIEKTVNLGKFAMMAAWLAVATLIALSGVTMLLGHLHVGQWFGFAACALSAYAATANIRCYMVRIASMIRSLHDMEPSATQRRNLPVRQVDSQPVQIHRQRQD